MNPDSRHAVSFIGFNHTCRDVINDVIVMSQVFVCDVTFGRSITTSRKLVARAPDTRRQEVCHMRKVEIA